MGKASAETPEGKARDAANLVELARWVPLRLCATERHLLAVLEQTLHVSEYTDNVDISSRRGGLKTRRILDGILEACHISTGLASSSGQEREIAALCRSEFTPDGSNNNPCSADGIPQLLSKKKKKRVLKNGKGKKKKSKTKPTEAEHDNNNDESFESNMAGSTSSWAARQPEENAIFFQTMFEIGRRNKVLNPSSMRTTYGKLMYLLQDAQNPSVAQSLGFSLHKELVLVKPFLEEHNSLDLLHDPRLECAVQYIDDRDPDTGEKLPREQVQYLVQGKRKVTEELVMIYGSQGKLSPDDVYRVVDSLADAISYIESNVRPVQQMLKYLEDNFDPDREEKLFSLALRNASRNVYSGSSTLYSKYGLSAYGSGSSEGPTLTHSHATQYVFVWQSLRLWSKVMRHMHRLWVAVDDDLLSTTSSYHLYNTGQGLNRVQACPRVRKVMSNLLQQTQTEAGTAWVGLSVIHLGDRDVPNALIFIDKYTQIPRFLNPIVKFLQDLPELCSDERIDAYVKEQFGSQQNLKMTVLADYFKHGFDGSGDDGGSCIDGRLTSSWNWTSRLAKKTYYHAFMLSGFQGFDGDFR